MPAPHATAIRRLEKQVSDVSSALVKLSNSDDWKQLIMIIHQPGFTSPQDLIFTSAILDMLLTQTAALKELKGQLLKGCEAIVAR